MYILPTIRINNGQYRGKLSVTEVMRALCAAFVKGKEPPACLKVKEDECRPGSVGDSVCSANKWVPCRCKVGFGAEHRGQALQVQGAAHVPFRELSMHRRTLLPAASASWQGSLWEGQRFS